MVDKKSSPYSVINLRNYNDQQPLIQVRSLAKTYKSVAGEFTVLKSINADFYAGEFIAVIGKSGSGKSTLVNMLTGIDRPTSGEVLVGGVEVHKLSEGQLAIWRGLNVGIVFQFFQLLPTLTVLENVRLPMDFGNMYTAAQRNQRAMQLLEVVGIQQHAHKLPCRLSGGQQQSAAIARALANDPQVLVTDEPTGNLDSHTAEQVFCLLHRLAGEGKTVVMVTHDSELAGRAGRTVTITDGLISN
jgi:putative ABC transport system ATP-binding protein